MTRCLERGKLKAVLLACLGWAIPAMAAFAQPAAMPITVLDNRDAAGVQPNVAGPMTAGQCPPLPQPMIAPAGPLDEPPSIAPPAGTIALPNPQPPPATWTPPWTWQSLPDGLMFKNYLASNEEGRIGSQLYYDKKIGWTWDSALGGHVGMIRYGTQDPAWPEGWQVRRRRGGVAAIGQRPQHGVHRFPHRLPAYTPRGAVGI